ncbi:MAG: ScpA family protein [Castellaniella sp.]|uniref:segregation and condensation protein A n=1 Tax=Castellaniella sp. TaxID=1955812 RepID=UPI002A35AA41|nr:ScpA family protein [Castellaniella sp.]MDY0308623.1 ScpA family protein [Castellaniella sp.]
MPPRPPDPGLDALMAPAEDSTPDVVDHVALARLYGEPLFSIPQDLYIPPDALEVFLEAFEGPLDLLLYLIRKQNFNVLDIPMAEVTAQYLAYVEQVRQSNLELAGEYLLMAALLIEIKSRMLLPVRQSDSGEEPEDPRAELVRRLLEYERMKLAARRLDDMPRVGRDFLVAHATADVEVARLLPDVSADDLREAWAAIMQRARLNASHRITREQLSVRDHMSHILRRLSDVRFMEFTELFLERVRMGEPAAVIVVHFLALLELAREALLEITQAAPYAPLYVRLSYTRSA